MLPGCVAADSDKLLTRSSRLRPTCHRRTSVSPRLGTRVWENGAANAVVGRRESRVAGNSLVYKGNSLFHTKSADAWRRSSSVLPHGLFPVEIRLVS